VFSRFGYFRVAGTAFCRLNWERLLLPSRSVADAERLGGSGVVAMRTKISKN
jgi:hypothetical protein